MVHDVQNQLTFKIQFLSLFTNSLPVTFDATSVSLRKQETVTRECALKHLEKRLSQCQLPHAVKELVDTQVKQTSSQQWKKLPKTQSLVKENQVKFTDTLILEPQKQ